MCLMKSSRKLARSAVAREQLRAGSCYLIRVDLGPARSAGRGSWSLVAR